MGRPGADVIVDHGISFLWSGHRDSDYAGYYWGVGYDGPLDPIKQAYGVKAWICWKHGVGMTLPAA
jgi:mannose/cellobiose epimerase-like protein (N-acyl-D-glucosamine 2-epimerase family)